MNLTRARSVSNSPQLLLPPREHRLQPSPSWPLLLRPQTSSSHADMLAAECSLPAATMTTRARRSTAQQRWHALVPVCAAPELALSAAAAGKDVAAALSDDEGVPAAARDGHVELASYLVSTTQPRGAEAVLLEAAPGSWLTVKGAPPHFSYNLQCHIVRLSYESLRTTTNNFGTNRDKF